MAYSAKSTLSENWLLALLLALALGASTLISPQSFADAPPGNSGKGNQGKSDKDSADGGKPHCQKSAQYLFLACKHRSHAERWERLAECENLLDTDERRSCFANNRELIGSAKQNCQTLRGSRKGVCEDIGRDVYQGWKDVDFVGDEDEEEIVEIEGNDYFPLTPSSTIYLTSSETRINREVTALTRKINKVTCRIVVEEEWTITEPDADADAGILLERVERLYGEDEDGNVWTCGVLRQQYDVLLEGKDPVVVSTEGSWEAGSDGALAGIAMRWTPELGDIERRSYALGIDEDLTEVIDPATMASDFVCGSEGTGDCLILRITTPLSPEGYRDEYYEIGKGLVYSENQIGEETLDIIQP
ncbi:MAG: hypothetical protein IMF06_09945 [Proteobacteria bacterium]|nr:hypothetical protein [Pseudomonadota bacterium]